MLIRGSAFMTMYRNSLLALDDLTKICSLLICIQDKMINQSNVDLKSSASELLKATESSIQLNMILN